MVKDSAAEVSEEEFDEIINNSHKIVVVDFYAEWCMPCLMMAPIIDELSETMKEVKFVKINTEDNEALSMKNKISSIPCFIVFKEGKEVGRIIGAHSADGMESKIRDYLK